MAKALTGCGHQITSVTTDVMTNGKIKPNTWLSTEYGKVIYWHELSVQFPFRLIFTGIWQIKRHDVVHLNSLFYPPSFILATFALWQKKAVVWSCRGNLEAAAMQYSTWKKRPILWFIRHFLLGKKLVFHATSPNERQQLVAYFGHKSAIVEIPNYMELPQKIKRDDTVQPFLLYVGRLHEIKALDHLLRALASSRHFLASDCILKIAGDDQNPYAQQLKELSHQLGITQKVEFLGHVEGSAKEVLYANAWFSILPSHSENFGNVVIESLAQGTPVIASKGTPWAILEEKQAGFWVENAPDQLSQRIDKALSLTETAYQSFRLNALKLVREHFDMTTHVGAWEEVYHNIT
jgi:glycosyltransferase involved in cell wall biosynthesis